MADLPVGADPALDIQADRINEDRQPCTAAGMGDAIDKPGGVEVPAIRLLNRPDHAGRLSR